MSTQFEEFDETLLHLAHRLVKAGQRDAAIQMVEQLVGSSPSNLDGWLFLAYHFIGVDNARAAVAWEHITRLRPYDDAAQQALVALREVLDTHPAPRWNPF
jgi:predicted TPR repeat methyltransferase